MFHLHVTLCLDVAALDIAANKSCCIKERVVIWSGVNLTIERRCLEGGGEGNYITRIGAEQPVQAYVYSFLPEMKT